MTGMHKHCCPNCNHIWEHSDANFGNRDAHTCSDCGTVNFYKHFDDEVGQKAKIDAVQSAASDIFKFLLDTY